MSKLLIDLRSSFWFIPALVTLLAALLALLAVELDTGVGSEALARFPRLFGAGAEGTRQLLSAIASSTITVAGVVFSITIVALSLTAAQYSPRVLRGFMRDRANQLVLGIFLGLYVYCLLVLRTIRGGEHEFVPGISVLGAIAFALVGIGFLIFFIHHIATSIQVSEIAARVATETISAVESEYGGGTESPDAQWRSTDERWTAVPAVATGYVQSVDRSRLIDRARRCDTTVRMLRASGDFVVRGETLLWVSTDEVGDELISALNGAYAINTYRDVAQDPAFGVQQLVDIALKALSPGVNDTATARTCLDYLTAVLLELMRHEVRDERVYADADGSVRLIAVSRSLDYFVASTFDAIRRNSLTNVDMLLHTLQSLERVGRMALPSGRTAAIGREIEAIHQAVLADDYTTGDRQALLAGIERAFGALRPAQD